MPVDEWNADKVIRVATAHVGRNMKRAVLLVQKDVQRRLSVGQPVRRAASGRLYGTTAASAAPTAPRVLTGDLRKSIGHRVDITAGDVVGIVGARTAYARRLELGFFGTDSKGRNVNQAERPYLRPAIKDNLPKLIRIIGAP